MTQGRTSAFIVRVPAAEACVGALPARFDPAAVEGVAAHITILFPFMDVARISAEVLDRAASAMQGVAPFVFALGEVGRFPGIAFLAPEPAAPFVELTKALAAAFPDYPPYGGQHPSTAPHLTIANRGAEAADFAAAEAAEWLRRHGPIRASCDTVTLIENSGDRWTELHAFPLQAGRASGRR